MNSKLLYNQIKEQLPPMEGVAVKVEDNKMNFYIDGRLEFYVRESGGVINNTHGHHSGDEVIKTVANCLLKTIGTKADVYRVGGDEFVCIAECDISGYISEFRDCIGFENRTRKVPFTVSLGYMKYSSEVHKNIDELIIECDKQMYTYKRKQKYM